MTDTETKTLRHLLDDYSSGEMTMETLLTEVKKVNLSTLEKDEGYNKFDGESWDSSPHNSQAVLDSAVDVGILTHDEHERIFEVLASKN